MDEQDIFREYNSNKKVYLFLRNSYILMQPAVTDEFWPAHVCCSLFPFLLSVVSSHEPGSAQSSISLVFQLINMNNP